MTPPRLVSSRFPFVPIRLRVRTRDEALEALLDTGVDDDAVVPAGRVGNGRPADGYIRPELGDASLITAPHYDGTVELAGLGTYPVVAIALGDESIVSRGLTDQFRIVVDHGQRLMMEP